MPTGSVDFVRYDLVQLLWSYDLIRDCLGGEPYIKGWIQNKDYRTVTNYGANMSNGGGLGSLYTPAVVGYATRYLPMPNPEDTSIENRNRYRSYIQRAVFYNVTKRTLAGMVGQIFLRPPTVTIPSSLDILETDADGSGLSLEQTANKIARNVMAYGRCGVFADYPSKDDGVTSVLDLKQGNVHPVIKVYEPWNIVNWRTVKVGARKLLSLVVLREEMTDDDNDADDDSTVFEPVTYVQYRVLRLDSNGNYIVEIWSPNEGNEKTHTLDQAYTVLDGAGKPLKEIQFWFAGSVDNDESIDDPPIYDLASLNISHYRSSADYEESSFLLGQPTPYFTGLTEAWVTNVLKGNIVLGSRASVALPAGASAGLLQVSANSMPMEAMKHKEDQMVAIGAKLVQTLKVNKTATQTIVEETSETSTLTTVSVNSSVALTNALRGCARFVNENDTQGIECKLNKDFDVTSMTPEQQLQVIKTWQAGGIAFSEMREQLRRAGVATLDDDTAKTEIETDQTSLLERNAKLLSDAATTKAVNNPDPNA